MFFAIIIFFLRKPSSTMPCKALKILKWVKVPGKNSQKFPGGDFWKPFRNNYNAYNGGDKMRFRSDIKDDMANLHFELKDEIEKRASATGKTEQEVLAADPVLLGKILMLNKVDLILGDEFS